MARIRVGVCAALGATAAAMASPAWAEEGASARPAVSVPGRLRERDAEAALREILRLSVAAAAARLSNVAAFAVGEPYHINLPDALLGLRGDWNAVGRSGALPRLEEAMNRAAAAAAAPSAAILLEKAADLDFYDSVAVVRSGDQAGAKFFAMRARADIEQRVRPIVVQALAGAGAYAALADAAQAAGGAGKAGAYQDMVIQRTLSGLLDAAFAEIGRHEADTRASPAGRGSPVLEQVFSRGAQSARATP